MITKYAMAAVVGMAFFAGAAFAETISGTITNIDPNSGRVTLRRDGVSENLEVTIRDRASLASLRSGSAVSLDASRLGSGSYEASTIQTAGTPTASSSMGSGVDTTHTSNAGTASDSVANTR